MSICHLITLHTCILELYYALTSIYFVVQTLLYSWLAIKQWKYDRRMFKTFMIALNDSNQN